MQEVKLELLSTRIRLAIQRAYFERYIIKPIEELTDRDILSIRNIGQKSLSEIRKVYSYKESNVTIS